ncbi:hypothetical protein D046_3170, partial [Vibrio parahaemolyticus V-223/04]
MRYAAPIILTIWNSSADCARMAEMPTAEKNACT